MRTVKSPSLTFTLTLTSLMLLSFFTYRSPFWASIHHLSLNLQHSLRALFPFTSNLLPLSVPYCLSLLCIFLKINDDKEEQHNLYQSLLFPSVCSSFLNPLSVFLSCSVKLMGGGGGVPLINNPLPSSCHFFYPQSICLSLTPNVLFSFCKLMKKDTAPFPSSLHPAPHPPCLPPM